MLRIWLADSDVASVRATYSPYWDLLAAAMVAAPTGGPPSRDDVPAAARMLAALPSASFLRYGLVPGFLAPIPLRAGEAIEMTLARIKEVDEARIQSDVAEVAERVPHGGPLVTAWSRPRGELERLVSHIEELWQRALRPVWPTVAAIQEGELVRTGLLMAGSGPEAALEDLHPTATLRSRLLCYRGHRDGQCSPGGMGVVLLSSVFAPQEHVVIAEPGRPTILLRPPAGRSLLWSERPNRFDPARALIGGPRADILRRLAVPRATADLGRLLGMAPNTTSYHLSRLRQAGLVRSVRVGRRVYYGLSSRGTDFLALWPGNPADPASTRWRGHPAALEEAVI